MSEVAILAAPDRFLDVISPNDARALVSFEKLRREVILHAKTGALDAAYFRRKFGVEIITHFEA